MNNARRVPVPGLNNRIGIFSATTAPWPARARYRAIGRIEALFAFEHIPRFRTRMQMRPCARSRRHHDVPELNLKRSRPRKRQGPDAPNQTACSHLRFGPQS